MPAFQLRDASILLSSLPDDQAAAVLARLAPQQAAALRAEIAQGKIATVLERREVMRAFSRARQDHPQDSRANVACETTASCEEKNAVTENAPSRFARFRFLRAVDGRSLLASLKGEHPQTIAVVVSHLPPSLGATVVSGLGADLQLAVIRRIATMDKADADAVGEVEACLRQYVSHELGRYEQSGGISAAAEILNAMDRACERALLGELAERDADLVDEIRRRMFAFAHLVTFSNKDIQTISKHVATAQWAMAFKGADSDVAEAIFRNMSQRAANMLREEMEYLGSVRPAAVEQVQQQIVDIVRRLEEMGEISSQAAVEANDPVG